jgi:hypothetical protein
VPAQKMISFLSSDVRESVRRLIEDQRPAEQALARSSTEGSCALDAG